jgi:hypothetical protein
VQEDDDEIRVQSFVLDSNIGEGLLVDVRVSREG